MAPASTSCMARGSGQPRLPHAISGLSGLGQSQRPRNMPWRDGVLLQAHRYHPTVSLWLMLVDMPTTAAPMPTIRRPFQRVSSDTAIHFLWPNAGQPRPRTSPHPSWTRILIFQMFTLPKNGEAAAVASGTGHYYSSLVFWQLPFSVLDSYDGEPRSMRDCQLAARRSGQHFARLDHRLLASSPYSKDLKFDTRNRTHQNCAKTFCRFLEAGGFVSRAPRRTQPRLQTCLSARQPLTMCRTTLNATNIIKRAAADVLRLLSYFKVGRGRRPPGRGFYWPWRVPRDNFGGGSLNGSSGE